MAIYKENNESERAEVQETIQYLAEKGVNVTEIEHQTKATEDRIAELDEKLEELPEIKEKLIEQYQREKDEQLKINQNKDYVRERGDENRAIFCLSPKRDSYSKNSLVKTEVAIDLENKEVKRRR
ncbi:hypothetical protein VO54_01080 [Elizabethkingia miricola]|nr:hypothetical protein VO54_01080 [Elizabethkingia miricola]